MMPIIRNIQTGLTGLAQPYFLPQPGVLGAQWPLQSTEPCTRVTGETLTVLQLDGSYSPASYR